MARPSVMMRIGTPDFLSKFTFYFEEHVEGFTGLRGSKRERTEQEKNMEWRKRLEAKKKVKKTSKQDTEQARLEAIQRYKQLKKSKKSAGGKSKARVRF
mmetsp:Transcript_45124/g.72144  ORF Transcript_45124/g.72144 Transcript_45124/m.72144 type:complete len:99 (-) Transcript_45124:742-1038(-)|eukprot:CAMPEP_0203745178 /NCGR_PEP_ID=MMETSP0098-20131031/1003_1 /ASSEMBLY_ACC=CAM_ASM_000208 /TAXON_ID=96639 /ORGANISM=" , Strain NY0313808BC1" /LENGTH=98 /DNA_ID=CAMNT_0050632887 /DNA_START=162 /DNA_END=458 /DNA_ORIENTATION=+